MTKAPTIELSTDKDTYSPGDPVYLSVRENFVAPMRTIEVDGLDSEWPTDSDDGETVVLKGLIPDDAAGGTIELDVTLTRTWDRQTANGQIGVTVERHDDPPPPPPTGDVLWGMSSPAAEWTTRAREVGPGLLSRRVFDAGMNIVGKAQECVRAGLFPVTSIKVGDWGNAASGSVDQQVDQIAQAYAELDVPIFFTCHHEPGDGEGGTLPEWIKMNLRLGKRVKAIAPKATWGTIDNGFKLAFGTGQAYSNSALDAYYSDEYFAETDVFAADCYHGGTMASPQRDAVIKIDGMRSFCDRRGYTGAMGIGEYNGITAQAITNAQTAIEADDRFVWACIFNSNENNRAGVQWVLTGDRLAAFRGVLV